MKARNFLVFSLLGNVALVGVVSALISRRSMEAPVNAEAPPAHSQSPLAAIRPFRWSQLESSDYPTYIVNLRAIGCPERTVGDIITADIDSLYAPKRRQLDVQERQLTANGQEEQSMTRQNFEVERQRLWQEETKLIARLLGWQQATLASATSAAQTNEQQAAANSETTPQARFSMPLVFAAVHTNTLNLTPRQQVFVEGLRQQFLNELGGTSTDPDSPEYAERWRRAQPEVDQRLKTVLGYQTYRKFAQQAGGQNTPSPK